YFFCFIWLYFTGGNFQLCFVPWFSVLFYINYLIIWCDWNNGNCSLMLHNFTVLSRSIWPFDLINLQGTNISVESFLSMNSFLSKFFQNCSTLFCIYLIYCFLITNVHDIFSNNH